MEEKTELDGGEWERVEGDAVLREGALRELLGVAEWTEEQARAVLSAQRRSGLSIIQFCRRLGIKPWRLYRWRHLYRGQRSVVSREADVEPSATLPSPFVPLRVVAAAEPRAVEAPCAEFVSVSGDRVLLWPHAPESWVRALVHARVRPC